MIFKDFLNIEISDDLGTSPVGKDTMIIAKRAREIDFKSALDVGTGTGFLSIYLTKCGYHCEGSDINSLAIECANKNASRNGLKINYYVSDLFENINKKFDLIIFNPPFGNTKSPILSKYLEIVKSILPKENRFIANMSYQMIKKRRANLIKHFLDTCTNFLTKNGRVLVLLHDSELSLINGLLFEILDIYLNMKLVLIRF